MVVMVSNSVFESMIESGIHRLDSSEEIDSMHCTVDDLKVIQSINSLKSNAYDRDPSISEA